MPGELKSMKINKSDKKSRESVVFSEPEYPFGLALNLDNESLKKLGITELPKVGKEMSLAANVVVVASRQSSSKDGKDHKSVEIQITDMAISDKKLKKDSAKTLYGG